MSTYDDRGRPLQESEQWQRGTDSYAYSRATAWTGRTAQVFEDLGAGRQTSRTIELDGLGKLNRHTRGSVTDRRTFGSDGLLTEERIRSSRTFMPRMRPVRLVGQVMISDIGVHLLG